MRSGSRCPAFYREIPPTRWGILDDDGGYFYCITYTKPRAIIGTSALAPGAIRASAAMQEAYKAGKNL